MTTKNTLILQIASIALVNGATLVTRNTDDFCDIDGLVVANWFE